MSRNQSFKCNPADWSGGCLTPGGSAGQVRSRKSASDEEAHRTPPGKQAPGAEISLFPPFFK